MKISVIFTGGTIGSRINASGNISPDEKTCYRLLDMYEKEIVGEGGDDISYSVFEPYTILSENL